MIMNERLPDLLRHLRASALVLAAFMVAACGSNDGGMTLDDPATTPGTAAPATPQTGGTSTVPAEQMFTVSITDQGIEVSPTSARPGPATFEVTNNATHAQEVEIDGPGDDGDIDNLPPNQTRNVHMTLEAGEYEIKTDNEDAPDQTRRTRLVVAN